LSLQKKPTFKDMVLVPDLSQLKEWMPLVMEGEMSQKSSYKHTIGTDVNFGELTRSILVI
jgi:malate dehydrogenase (quinone)